MSIALNDAEVVIDAHAGGSGWYALPQAIPVPLRHPAFPIARSVRRLSEVAQVRRYRLLRQTRGASAHTPACSSTITFLTTASIIVSAGSSVA